MVIDRGSRQQRAHKYRAVYEDRGWRYKDSRVVYYRTGGSRGLTKSDLMENREGKIVSKRRHALGKRQYAQNRKAMEQMQFA